MCERDGQSYLYLAICCVWVEEAHAGQPVDVLEICVHVLQDKVLSHEEFSAGRLVLWDNKPDAKAHTER